MMATMREQIEGKQTVLKGNLSKVKGLVREQWGTASNDDLERLAGKKDQLVGEVQANLGDSWVYQKRKWLLSGTAVALFVILTALLLKRSA